MINDLLKAGTPVDIIKATGIGISKLVERIAPDNAANNVVYFIPNSTGPDAIGPPGTLKVVNLNGKFNNLLVSLKSGIVWFYIGVPNDGPGNWRPDMRLGPTINPLPIPFMSRGDKVVSFRVDPTSQAAEGTVFIQYY